MKSALWRSTRLAAGLALASAPVLPGAAGAQPTAAVSASSWPAPRADALDGPRHFSTARSGRFGGKLVRYDVLLEETIVRDRSGQPASSVFTTAFVAQGKRDPARPVIFVFNGGPGGASNTLMLGALAPVRMASFTPEAQADPNVPLVPNADCILDAADIVIYDPPETGFGSPLPDADRKAFRSVDGDSSAGAQVVLRWLDRHGRQGAPVYLLGESYGAHRAVAMARDLRVASPAANVAGLVLVSQALNYNGPNKVGHLPDPLRPVNGLIGIVPLAWYHGLIDNRTQTLDQAVSAARAFAHRDYAAAVLAGNRIGADERSRVASGLERITGVPATYWRDHGLVMAEPRRELLASRGLALDQFDGRETEPLDRVVPDDKRDWDTVIAGLTSAMERFTQQAFGATGLPPFRSVVRDPYRFEDTWTYTQAPQPGMDAVLAEQLKANARLKVMFAFGVFDTTSSMGATELLRNQLPAGPERVAIRYYPGGHMLYSDDAGRAAFNQDIRGLVSGSLPVDGRMPEPTPPAQSEVRAKQ